MSEPDTFGMKQPFQQIFIIVYETNVTQTIVKRLEISVIYVVFQPFLWWAPRQSYFIRTNIPINARDTLWNVIITCAFSRIEYVLLNVTTPAGRVCVCVFARVTQLTSAKPHIHRWRHWVERVPPEVTINIWQAFVRQSLSVWRQLESTPHNVL